MPVRAADKDADALGPGNLARLDPLRQVKAAHLFSPLIKGNAQRFLAGGKHGLPGPLSTLIAQGEQFQTFASVEAAAVISHRILCPSKRGFANRDDSPFHAGLFRETGNWKTLTQDMTSRLAGELEAPEAPS